jgi:hypothetical protein
MVDSIAVLPDYIFLILGQTIIIPRRDFPSDETYQEFKKLIIDFMETGKDLPITMELVPADNK